MKGKRFIAAFLSLMLMVSMLVPSASAKGSDRGSTRSQSSWNQTQKGNSTVDSAEEAASQEDTSTEADESTAYLDGTLTGSDGVYSVTVTFDADAQIPEGSTVSVKELSESDEAYQEAKEQVGPEDEEQFAALDISILDANGNEIEPASAVSVTIEVSELPEGMSEDSTITISHINESTGTPVAEAVADTADATEGTVTVTDNAAVQATFTVDSFSTFTISWSSGSGGGSTTYFRVTVHYVNESGTEIQGTQTSNISTSSVSNSNRVTYTFSDYAGTISGYTYSGATYNGKTVTSMTFSQTTSTTGGNKPQTTTTRTLTFYNGSSTAGTLTYDSRIQTADVYLVYTTDSTGGGSTGDGSGGSSTVTSATVNASKTTTLNDDGTYDLTLSITGDRGSVEQKVAVDIVFILDKSGSMRYKLTSDSNAGNNEKSRMDLLQEAVGTLVATIEANENIEARYAAVGFAGASQTTTQSWTNASGISSFVNGLSANGGTNYQAGIYQAKQLLNNAREGAITFVIFVSDGEPTYRGTTSDTGTGSSDPNGSNINAAVTEIGSMSCNYFYAIGMGPTFTSNGTGMTNLTSLANAVKATNGTGVYSASNETSFTNAFKEITSSITFFAAENVTITDELSEYADLVLDAGDNPQLTITVTYGTTTWTNNGSGTTLTFKNASNEDVTLTASYDEDTKTITLDFPDDYELEEGYTYSISTVITASEAAITAGEDGYNGIGEAGTGTHENEEGFYSNGEAKVTYTANGEEGSASFPKPVIQLQYFYVYHSSDQSVDSYLVTDKFDITDVVKAGYLYGGYYSSYLKAGTYEGGPEATYDGTSYTGAIAGYWDSDAAYTNKKGTLMTPVAGRTYYLKEVPDEYFQPSMALIYDTYTDPYDAVGLYLISATDDKNYQDFGLEITSKYAGEDGYELVKSYVLSFAVQQQINGGSKEVITAKTAFGVPTGYLGVWNADEELIKDNVFSYRPYVVTPDGVKVYGTTSRTVYVGDVTYRNTLDEGPGVYKVDITADD